MVTRLHALSPEKQPRNQVMGPPSVNPTRRPVSGGTPPPPRLLPGAIPPHMRDCEDAGVQWANTFLSLGMTKARPAPAEMLRLQQTFGMYPDGIHAYGPRYAHDSSDKSFRKKVQHDPKKSIPGAQTWRLMRSTYCAKPTHNTWSFESRFHEHFLGNRPLPVHFG